MFGLRLPLEYRPWVYEQISAPGYDRKRWRGSLAIQLTFVVIPQTTLALAAHSRIRLVAPLLLLVFFGVLAVRGRAMTPAMRRRVFAYHGLTTDGALVEPWTWRRDNPLGRVGLALLCAQVLLFSSGVAIAADRIDARRDCKPVAADVLVELARDIGAKRPGPAFPAGIPGFPHEAPIAGIVPGGPLLHARQVATPFPGIVDVAAYVRSDSGRLIGPAVWQVVEPGTTFLLPARDLRGLDATARVLTPSLGFSYGGTPDPLIDRAKECARAAR